MIEPSKEPEKTISRISRQEIATEKEYDPEASRSEFSAAEIAKSEKQQLSKEDSEKVEEQIRLEIERMQLNPALEEEAKKKANKIEFLGEKEKIEHLIIIAQQQGLAFAIKVARETNDPYLLDVFHDILVKEGFYKKFLRQ